MKHLYSLLFSATLFIMPLAQANEVQCQLKVTGLDTTVSAGGSNHNKSHSNAVELCVEKRIDEYQKSNGIFPGEETYSLFIDKCTTAVCEKS